MKGENEDTRIEEMGKGGTLGWMKEEKGVKRNWGGEKEEEKWGML